MTMKKSGHVLDLKLIYIALLIDRFVDLTFSFGVSFYSSMQMTTKLYPKQRAQR